MLRFYDAHCHMMNLSHPNLSSIIRRVAVEVVKPLLLRYSLVLMLVLLLLFAIKMALSLSFPEALFSLLAFVGGLLLLLLLLFAMPPVRARLYPVMKRKLSNVMNLLAMMETDIGDGLIQLEEDLRRNFPLEEGLVLSGYGGERRYEKIVLTPLIMDFGLKEYGESNWFYKVRWKPVVRQVEDLFGGIHDYYTYRNKYLPGSDPLFEFYPFMGINTRNYTMADRQPRGALSQSLERVLENCFNVFEEGKPRFIGIKVYPPLGFNPWPDERWEKSADEEMRKVRCLYEFCVKHAIPITAHCSPGGFLVDKRYKEFSDPKKWENVLREYPSLRLNLAHFGGAGEGRWRDTIIGMILSREYEHLYADISYQGVNSSSYDALRRRIEAVEDPLDRQRLMERIIFGSDFMINLQDIGSYSEYLRYFVETGAFTVEEKDLLCRRNAERFLFVR